VGDMGLNVGTRIFIEGIRSEGPMTVCWPSYVNGSELVSSSEPIGLLFKRGTQIQQVTCMSGTRTADINCNLWTYMSLYFKFFE
jgi:hypothetical protein